MPALIRPAKGRGNRVIPPGIRRVPLNRGWARVVVCASGPSFSQEQVNLIQAARGVWRVIVVNSTYQRIPDADVLYAGDRTWWSEYLPKVRAEFSGECFTVNRWIAHHAGLSLVEHSDEPGLSRVAGRIHTGGNSGYAAIGLAYLFGAREILLVGFDFQNSYGMSHWHGDHPSTLSQDRPYAGWLARLPLLIQNLADEGVRVTNCSILTAIPEDVVPRKDLGSCLSLL